MTSPDILGKDYTLLLHSKNRHYWQHGVGLAIRKGTPYERIQIETDIEIIAIRIHHPIEITVASIYLPPNGQHSQRALESMLDNLEGPVLLMGDFNAHHLAWGSNTASELGRFIAEETLLRQLVVLNDGSPTRIDPATGNTSMIDISICSENVAHKLTWETVPDLHNSDHFPIVLRIPEWSNTQVKRRKWLYDQANWLAYETAVSESIRPGDKLHIDEFAKRILTAATKYIPRSSGKTGARMVPWWCPEVKAAIKMRRKYLRALQRLSPVDPARPSTILKFKDASKAARKAIYEAKQRTWKAFVDRLSPHSSAKELWRTVNVLRGNRQNQSPTLKRADGFIDNPVDVAEELAKHYCEQSATSNYPPLFQITKEKAEKQHLNSSTDNNDIYNHDFTIGELLWALDRSKSTSTGPDAIGYPMLRRLPFSVKTSLLESFNDIWNRGIYPLSWRTGLVVPIPKPNCDNFGPAAFRPITLTSCLAKVFERIVNRRLMTELESKGRLDKRQHAFRPGRGIDTYLSDLERSLPLRGEHCLVASLDLSKAYDTTWRYGILRTLKSWQLRGRMFNMIQSFLSEREFKVNVKGHVSQSYPQENGVPQGSVLSVTLFLVAMQSVFKAVPAAVDILCYADDILLTVRRDKKRPLHRNLQRAVRAVDKWAKSIGFTLSASKSHIFYCSPNARRNPTQSIRINDTTIPITKELRVLGVTIDQSLTFRSHCRRTKKECASRLRILKLIGGKLPRGNRTTLLQVGSAIITSKLLYGIGIVSRGGQKTLQILAPAYNTMVRFSSGAYVTSPIIAIMAEVGALPFEYLAARVIIRIAFRMLEKDSINTCLPVVLRASQYAQNITRKDLPNIAVITRSTERLWHTSRPSVIWDVRKQVSAGDPPNTVRPIVLELISRRFRKSTVLYTDGSKKDGKVGSGVFGNGLAKTIGLPTYCSVFSAEAYAIKTAINIPNLTNELLILSDSESCLKALDSGSSKHPWIQQIENVSKLKNVHFCWIPGHAGVQGNEKADQLANEATNSTPENIPIPCADAVYAFGQLIRQRWEREWQSSRDVKLREIKRNTIKWSDRCNAADQRLLTRLRIGHTRLTHTFLLKKEPPPICETCGVTTDVRHILLSCRKYEQARQENNIESTSLHAVLQNKEEAEIRILKYLKDTSLYRQL